MLFVPCLNLKKDLISDQINNPFANTRISLYGWHRKKGHPLQPLSRVHGISYVDYSHGIRLISRMMLIDGKLTDFSEILTSPTAARLLSGKKLQPSASFRL